MAFALRAKDFHPGVPLLTPQAEEIVLAICGPVQEESDAPDAEWYALSKASGDTTGLCTPVRVRVRDLRWSWTPGKDRRNPAASGERPSDAPWFSAVGSRKSYETGPDAHPDVHAAVKRAEQTDLPARHPVHPGDWYLPALGKWINLHRMEEARLRPRDSASNGGQTLTGGLGKWRTVRTQILVWGEKT